MSMADGSVMMAAARIAGRRAFSVAIYARRGGVGGQVLMIMHRRLQTWLPVGGELESGETPLEAAMRELGEETGLAGTFPRLTEAHAGVPPGLLGYEEHMAGSKGLHMNFVFVADVPQDAEVTPNDEFSDFRWVGSDDLTAMEMPLNAEQFARSALAAK